MVLYSVVHYRYIILTWYSYFFISYFEFLHTLFHSSVHTYVQTSLGDLIAIVGQVGSGKSSILGGLLGAYVDFIDDSKDAILE